MTTNTSQTNSTEERLILVHLGNPQIIITAPSGTLGSIVVGDNETLNYSITEAGQNLSEHLQQCWFEYNNTEVLNNISYTSNIQKQWEFNSSYSNVTEVNIEFFFIPSQSVTYTNIPTNCSRSGNFTLIADTSGISRKIYCLDNQNNQLEISSISVIDIIGANITAMQKRPLNCTGTTEEFEYVFNKNSLCVHAIDEFGIHSQNDTVWDYLFIEGDSNFNNVTYETQLETFELQIQTLPTVLNVASVLNHNGTRYTASTTCDSGTCNITTSINMPSIDTSSEVVQFFWELTIFTGSTSQGVNTTTMNQTINEILFEECDGANVTVLNFTSFDESTLDSINSFDFDANFQFWIGNGGVKDQYNLTKSGVSSVAICIFPGNLDFKIDADIEYDETDSDNYTRRNYHFLNDTVNNVSQNIELGLLQASDSTSFIESVQDANLLAVPDVLVETQRYYPGLDEFKTVQIGKTDKFGRTVGFFKTETVEYRFIIRDEIEELLRTTKAKVIGTSVPFTITFTVGDDLDTAWKNFETIPNFNSDLSFNETGKTITWTYIDDNILSFESANLLVYLNNGTNDQILVCDEDGNESSQTLVCNLSLYDEGTFTVITILTRDGVSQIINQTIFTLAGLDIENNYGLFLGLLIIIVCAFAFKYNEIAGIILLNVGIIATDLIGFINFGWIAIFGFISISIIIISTLER
jgi:protein associated with RNAse G/E